MRLLLPATRSQDLSIHHSVTNFHYFMCYQKTLADKHNSTGHDDSAFAWTARLHTVNLQQFPCLKRTMSRGRSGSCNCAFVTKPTCCKIRHHQPNLILYKTVYIRNQLLANKNCIYLRYSLLHVSAVDHQHRGVAPTTYPVNNPMKPMFTDVCKLK
jgi:hypothetical protein